MNRQRLLTTVANLALTLALLAGGLGALLPASTHAAERPQTDFRPLAGPLSADGSFNSTTGLSGRPGSAASVTQYAPAEGNLPAGPLAPQADPFVLTVTAHRDTWVEEANPRATHGSGLELTVGQESRSVNQAVILLWFDLSALPADTVVISATLSLYSSGGPASPFLIKPQVITAPWHEKEVSWDTRPGTNSLGDAAVEHVYDGWTVFDVTSTVQAWQDRSLLNNGIALQPHATAEGYRTFEARKAGAPPELTVYYARRAVLTPVKDTWVGIAQPSTPHGAEWVLSVVGPDNLCQESHALLGFDLGSLPENIDVINATLSMYTRANALASADETALLANLYTDAILGAWDESTTNWNNAPAARYLEDPPAEFNILGYTDWDVTNIVQNWAGGLDPHGILLRVGPESTTLGYGFWSRESTEPPELVIEYGEAPPACNPITSVDVNGATAGLTGADYTFDVVYFPADADPPHNVGWQVTDYPGRLYGDQVTLSWATPGQKTLTVVTTHCDGSTSTVHTITISDPPPDCTLPLTGLHISGPVVIGTGSSYEFRASSTPHNATDPVTFTWEATGQPPSVETTDENYSLQNYLWNEAGGKSIRVTAENCGGSAVAYHGVEVVDPADLPDLVISNANNEVGEERILYVVHNQGNSAVPAGFHVVLERNTSTPAWTTHPSPLGPGDIGVGYLDFAWTCNDTSALAGVLADWTEDVVELDELNNRWNDTWNCDQQPPSIVSGPDILDISERRARVSWRTDEDCQSWVEYGSSPYNQPLTQPGSGAYITSHNVGLTGLTAGTTYYARAFCGDAAGLTVNSEAVAFETAPEGTDPPEIHRWGFQSYPSTFYEYWEVFVELEDDTYMDRVSCSMDGTQLGIDYSADTGGAYPLYSIYLSPYHLDMTRDEFFGQTHQMSCTAYRQHPAAYTTVSRDWDTSFDPGNPIGLWIEDPHPHHKIYVDGSVVPGTTTLDVTVRAAAFEWACTWSGFSESPTVPPGLQAVDCDDLAPMGMDTVELWIAGLKRATVSPGPSDLESTLTAWLGGLGVGTHELQVVAQKGSNQVEDSQNLIVEQGAPSLQVERSIRREGTTLEVTLDLHNAGTTNAYVMAIYDWVTGLQQVNRRDVSGHYEVNTFHAVWAAEVGSRRRNHVQIDFITPHQDGHGYWTLEPGADYSVKYVLVPVLFKQVLPTYIGDEDVQVELYDGQGPPGVESFALPGTIVDDPSYGMIPLENAVANAVGQADYLIVTNPRRVYSHLVMPFGTPGCEKLYSNMAELASLQNGVLGYLYTYSDTDVLDDLIEPGNAWADALNSVFSEVDSGYVLIVGETEVVAADYAGASQFATYAGIPDHVHDTDLWYANTAGKTARPELVVGRVIGNGLTELNTYLERAILAAQGEPGYAFSRSRAYVTNGNGDGEWSFQDDAQIVDHQLDYHFDQSVWINFMNDGEAAQIAYHQQYLPDRNLVLYRGHGNEDAWDDGFWTGAIRGTTYNFGVTKPVMLAAACTTGNYEKDDDLNIAEALLTKAASIYVGATEKSERWANSDAFVNFFSEWQTDESMGQALNQLKRQIWGWDGVFDHRKLWAFEYNLYGDPKYGRLETLASTLAERAEDETLSVTAAPQGVNLKVTLPELESSQVDRDDRVRIPGGGILSEPDTYPVPVWSLSVDFRPGRQVQDVQLIDRSGLVVTGSLSLPVVVPAIDCACAADDLAAPAQPVVEGWYPAQDRVLDWSVEKGPNGASTLHILLYPFYYHPDTGDALYYRKHQLAVETLDTAVRIESLETPPRGKEPGDPVGLQLQVNNGGRPQDVIVQSSVRTRGTNRVLGGLPLMTLHELAGTATVDLTWDTRRYAAGDYQVVVELLDTEGHLLDTAVAKVRLGTYGAQLTRFSASQETFAPGDLITLKMSVQNTGTVPIDGTGVFLVQQSEGLSVTEVFTVPFQGLAPGVAKNMSVDWDTRGVEGQSYRVLGYVKFFSQATEPMALTLYRPRILLPLVLRNQRG